VLAQLKKKYEGRAVFLSLTTEPKDTPATIAEHFPTELHYARASDAAWVKLLAMGGRQQVVPTHALIQADGNVLEVLEGAGGVEDAIERLVD
jgi:hypothetical protein